MAAPDPTLTITISGNNMVTVVTSLGAKAPKAVELNLSQLDREVINIFETLLRDGRIAPTRTKGSTRAPSRELIALGQLLYRALFETTGIDEFFQNQLRDLIKALNPGQRLRVELVFDQTTSDLAKLPWEWLYWPGGDFLATKANLVLTRVINTGEIRQDIKPAKGELKILVIIAQPEDVFEGIIEDPGTIKKVQNEIKAELQGLEQRVKGVKIVEMLDNPTGDDLDNALARYTPDVVHYVGYGNYDSQHDEASIALVEANKTSAYWCPSNSFAKYFESWSPQLVFLHLCQVTESDTRAAYMSANFAKLVPDMILKGIKAVIAMQYPVAGEVAQKFTRVFYENLGRGSIAAAVQEGRRQLNLDARTYHRLGAPVLIMHCNDGEIMSLRTELPGEETAAGTGAGGSTVTAVPPRLPER
jgi:hypothetical protein